MFKFVQTATVYSNYYLLFLIYSHFHYEHVSRVNRPECQLDRPITAITTVDDVHY